VSERLQVLALVLTSVTMTCGLMGMIVRYGLLPWMREHLVKPVTETNHQVSVNRHASPSPTVLDRIDDVMRGVETANERLDQHLAWAHEENQRLWHAIITGQMLPPNTHK